MTIKANPGDLIASLSMILGIDISSKLSMYTIRVEESHLSTGNSQQCSVLNTRSVWLIPLSVSPTQFSVSVNTPDHHKYTN